MNVIERLQLVLAKASNKGRGWQPGTAGDANLVCYDGDDITGVAMVGSPRNLALLSAAVNALPALLEIAELAAKYMPPSDRHKTCADADCTRCQLVAALAKLETP